MCTQGTWADALIIQAVADALKVTIQALHHLPLFTQFRKEILRLHLLWVILMYINYISPCINHYLIIKCLHFNVQ